MEQRPQTMHITLHIGRHKTGSTAIQVSLIKNADLLASQGVLVPKAGRPAIAPNGHHQLAWDLAKSGTDTEAFGALKTEINAFTGNDCIITSECLDQLKPDHIVKLADVLKPYETRVVVYLRNQVEAIESMYRTDVTHYNQAITFREFQKKSRNNYDYRKFLTPWIKSFGAKNVAVQIYSKTFLTNGDVIADFFGHLPKVMTSSFEKPKAEVNHGIPSPAVMALVLLRKAGASEQKIKHFTQWSFRNAHRFSGLFTFLPAEEARHEAERFKESNEWLRLKYFSDADPDNFLRLRVSDGDRYYPVHDVGSLLAGFIANQ
jgi:hypothetical protein